MVRFKPSSSLLVAVRNVSEELHPAFCICKYDQHTDNFGTQPFDYMIECRSLYMTPQNKRHVPVMSHAGASICWSAHRLSCMSSIYICMSILVNIKRLRYLLFASAVDSCQPGLLDQVSLKYDTNAGLLASCFCKNALILPAAAL